MLGYYAGLKRLESQRAKRRVELAEKIKAVHEVNDRVYGSPRVYEGLKADREFGCENTVTSVVWEHEIRPKTTPKFIPRMTHSNHQQPASENRLDRQFKAELPNRTGWWKSRTYPRITGGFTWLAFWICARGRSLAGRWPNWSAMHWRLRSLDAARIRDCFTTAIGAFSTPAGAYPHLLQINGMESSTGGEGNCSDNGRASIICREVQSVSKFNKI